MKKCRMMLRTDASEKSFLLFQNPESAYVWASTPNAQDLFCCEKIDLSVGEFIEAEWLGCEFTRSDDSNVRIDRVRFAKAHVAKGPSGTLVSTHYGWVIDGNLPFNDHIDDNVIVRRLLPDEESLHLDILFKDVDLDDR